MAGLVSAVMRAGLAVTAARLRGAVQSYADDRMESGRTRFAGYVRSVGYAVAGGIFLIAALLVGAAALFHWVEERYGIYQAFGATGGALVLLALIAILMARAATRPPKPVKGLGERLNKAVAASAPTPPEKVLALPAPAPGTATKVRRPPVNGLSERSLEQRRKAAAGSNLPHLPTLGTTAAAMAVGLLGWAFARRYDLSSRLTRRR